MSSSVTSGIGKRQPNAVAERIFNVEYDTLTYKGSAGSGARITTQQLFPNPKRNSTILQSNSFPLGIGRAMKIIGMKIDHNIQFPKAQQLQAFELFSRITVELDDVNYSPLPIGDYLSYSRAAFSSTDDAATPVAQRFTPLAKGGNYTKLPRPIIVPESGSIKFMFVPGGDFTTKEVTEANGAVKFGAGVVDDVDSPVFFLKVQCTGELLRETARQLHTA